MTLVDPRGSGQVVSFLVPRQEAGVHTEEVDLSSARGPCMHRYQPLRVGQQPEDLQGRVVVVLVLLWVHCSRGLLRELVIVVAIQAT